MPPRQRCEGANMSHDNNQLDVLDQEHPQAIYNIETDSDLAHGTEYHHEPDPNQLAKDLVSSSLRCVLVNGGLAAIAALFSALPNAAANWVFSITSIPVSGQAEESLEKSRAVLIVVLVLLSCIYDATVSFNHTHEASLLYRFRVWVFRAISILIGSHGGYNSGGARRQAMKNLERVETLSRMGRWVTVLWSFVLALSASAPWVAFVWVAPTNSTLFIASIALKLALIVRGLRHLLHTASG